MADDTSWAVVVPVKVLAVAKSRLSHLSDAGRADVALAMAGDVVGAAAATSDVVGVVVVTNDRRAAAELEALGARVVADTTDSGIDDALTTAARLARSLWPRCGLAALSGDLPCADAATLGMALRRAASYDRAVLADRSGDGTTLLTARPGLDLRPRYGAASRARHVRTGAQELDGTGLERLRLDVDTPADLAAALPLGVGPRTAAALSAAGVMLPGTERDPSWRR